MTASPTLPPAGAANEPAAWWRDRHIGERMPGERPYEMWWRTEAPKGDGWVPLYLAPPSSQVEQAPEPKPDPKPVLRFKVGDWAKVVAVPAARAYGWAGRRVQVLSIGGPDTLDYRVTDLPADGKEPTRWIWLREADLEPAEAEPILTRADVRREFIKNERELAKLFEEEAQAPNSLSRTTAYERALSRMEAGK